jgi:hypothetical protein
VTRIDGGFNVQNEYPSITAYAIGGRLPEHGHKAFHMGDGQIARAFIFQAIDDVRQWSGSYVGFDFFHGLDLVSH